MTSAGAPIRRCPECGEEFQPHVVDCSDCGTPLVSAFEGDGALEAAGDAGEAPAAEETVTLLSGVTPATADQAAERLTSAGIPFRLAADPRRGLRLGVTLERAAEALAVLGREGIVPEQPDSAEGAVAIEGGPCPACGDHVTPGTVECAGCGLQLAGALECPQCGAELPPSLDGCPECARERD